MMLLMVLLIEFLQRRTLPHLHTCFHTDGGFCYTNVSECVYFKGNGSVAGACKVSE